MTEQMRNETTGKGFNATEINFSPNLMLDSSLSWDAQALF